MSSLVEAVQAIKAAKENTKLPVICTFTFDQKPRGYFTMMGVTPEQAAEGAAAAGADIVGANCGNGIANMIQISKRMRAALPESFSSKPMPACRRSRTAKLYSRKRRSTWRRR